MCWEVLDVVGVGGGGVEVDACSSSRRSWSSSPRCSPSSPLLCSPRHRVFQYICCVSLSCLRSFWWALRSYLDLQLPSWLPRGRSGFPLSVSFPLHFPHYFPSFLFSFLFCLDINFIVVVLARSETIDCSDIKSCRLCAEKTNGECGTSQKPNLHSFSQSMK